MKNKKLKVVIIILIIICFLSLLGFYLNHYIENIKKDRRETLVLMNEIKEKYTEFSPSIDSFKDKRAEFYNLKENEFYFENIYSNPAIVTGFIDEYESIILNIDGNSKFLKDNCFTRYADYTVNNKCNLFKQEYEAVINYYLTDLNIYNTIIDLYNNWLIENSLEGALENKKFELYSEYIDYDHDGSFLGGN